MMENNKVYQNEFNRHQRPQVLEFLKTNNFDAESLKVAGHSLTLTQAIKLKRALLEEMEFQSPEFNQGLELNFREVSGWGMKLKKERIKANWNYFKFSRAVIHDCEFKDALFSECQLMLSDLRNSKIRFSQWHQSSWTQNELSFMEFEDCYFDVNADFFKVNSLGHTRFKHCFFERLNLIDCDQFELVDFEGCQFKNLDATQKQKNLLAEKNLVLQSFAVVTSLASQKGSLLEQSKNDVNRKNQRDAKDNSQSNQEISKKDSIQIKENGDLSRFGLIEELMQGSQEGSKIKKDPQATEEPEGGL